MKKTKYFLQVLLGLFIMPILIFLFMLDRVCLAFLPHVKGYTIQDTFKDVKLFVPSLYRVILFVLIYFLYKFVIFVLTL